MTPLYARAAAEYEQRRNAAFGMRAVPHKRLDKLRADPRSVEPAPCAHAPAQRLQVDFTIQLEEVIRMTATRNSPTEPWSTALRRARSSASLALTSGRPAADRVCRAPVSAGRASGRRPAADQASAGPGSVGLAGLACDRPAADSGSGSDWTCNVTSLVKLEHSVAGY
jgi:hypothetical protein